MKRNSGFLAPVHSQSDIRSMADGSRLLSRDGVSTILRLLQPLIVGGGSIEVSISSRWQGGLRWARDRVSLAIDRRDATLLITRNIKGARASMSTNQLDEDSLRAVVRAAERNLQFGQPMASRFTMHYPEPELPYPAPLIWSDSTFNATAEQRGALARELMTATQQKGIVSAGYLEMYAGEKFSATFGDPWDRPWVVQAAGHGTWNVGERNFKQFTHSECSMTIRAQDGSASGWAGLSGYDWSAIDGKTLATRALDKCLASMNARTIEPGRYTVILEPQAVSDLMVPMIGSFDRETAELASGPWAVGYDSALSLGRTKLGLKVIDERITISHDPMDPRLGIVPFSGLGPITFVRNGVLETLSYFRDRYALPKLNEHLPESFRFSYQMSGGTTPMDQMIAETQRGLIVTRFWNVELLNESSLLSTGVTRDGLWLVEKGRITQAVRNMRFTDSPLFMLNQVEQLGSPTPVYHPDIYHKELMPVIVPAIKANDFAFTSTIDAV